jgi:peptidoglycan/LPS O-acetylase OafA/YrhL
MQGPLIASGPTLATVGDYFAAGRNNFHWIRLAAAWMVIYGHSYAITKENGRDLVLQLIGYRFAGGVAVEVFFLVSGFLVAASMARSSLPRYLWARFLRIFPALAVCAALTTFVLGPLLSSDPNYWREAQTWRYFYMNVSLITTEYFLPGVFQDLPDKAVNGSLWSLPLEVWLYLVIAAFGLFGLRAQRKTNGVLMTGFVVGYFAAPQIAALKPYSAWVGCVAFFAAGTFVWTNRDQIRLTAIGLATVLLFAAALHRSEHFFVAYFVALTYLTFYLAFVPRIQWNIRRDLSYGVYLYGWPAQQCVQLFIPGSGAIFNTFAASGLSLLLALASWELVERPCLALKPRVT